MALLVGASASAANARARVAISEFQIEGGAAPALGIQLQDGFVLGLVRAGVWSSIPRTRPNDSRAIPSCSAATPPPVSRRSGGSWRPATSSASRSTSRATATRAWRGCSRPKAPPRRCCLSPPPPRVATSAPSRRRARSCSGWPTSCDGTSKRPAGGRRRSPRRPRPRRVSSDRWSWRWPARWPSAPVLRSWLRTEPAPPPTVTKIARAMWRVEF